MAAQLAGAPGRGGVRRVVLTGPECTGKTTLARELAAAFAAPCIPEAARHYAETHPGGLSVATVAPIARLSMQLEDEALAGDPDLVVRDTDLVSTVVYSRDYYGEVAGWIAAEARARQADLYLLCRPDLPWAPDGIRDRPDRREELFAEFRAELDAMNATVVEIDGVGETRFAAAERAVRAMPGVSR